MYHNKFTFYPQTGLSFIIKFNTYDNFSECNFSFLSYNQNPNLILKSGRFIDPSGDFIFGTDPSRRILTISGNKSLDNFNYFIDGVLIDSQSGNYGMSSGIDYGWDGSFNFQNSGDDIVFEIYGDYPKLTYFYNPNGIFGDPIKLTISGHLDNYAPTVFKAANIDANDASFDLFEISGFKKDFVLNPGEIYEFYIVQKNSEYFITDYTIPLNIETDFAILPFELNLLRYSNLTQRAEVLFDDTIKGFTIDSLNAKSAFWPMILNLYDTNPSTDHVYFILSGADSNENYYDNGITSSFTGLWSVFKPARNEERLYPKIKQESNFLLKNKSTSQVIPSSSGLNISNNMVGKSFYVPFGENEFHNNKYKIEYIDCALFKSGIPLSKNNFFIGSTGFAYNIFSGFINKFYFTSIGNNISEASYLSYSREKGAKIDVKIYNINTGINSLNYSGYEIFSKQFILDDLQVSTTGVIEKFYLDTDYIFEKNKKYILALSGFSSGFVSGVLKSGTTNQESVFYNNFIYLSNSGNGNYISDFNFIFESGVSGSDNTYWNGIDNDNLNLNIYGEEFYDYATLTGQILTTPVLEQQSINLSINKLISFNDLEEYGGRSLFYITGNGVYVTGELFIGKDRFRNFEVQYRI